MIPRKTAVGGILLLCGILLARAQDRFTENFAGDFDLNGSTFTFKPDFSTNRYAVCRLGASALPTPDFGYPLLRSDAETTVSLYDQRRVFLYGNEFTTVWVTANGVIGFQPQTNEVLTPARHFAELRISALNTAMAPSDNAPVYFNELADRMAFTWLNVPSADGTRSNTFQVELFYLGEIRITYLDVESGTALVGLSDGHGLSSPFVEMDLSHVGCAGKALYQFALSPLPAHAIAGSSYALTVSGRDAFNLPFPVTTPVQLSARIPGATVYQEHFESETNGFSLAAGNPAASNTWRRTLLRDTEIGHSPGGSFFYGASATNLVHLLYDANLSVVQAPLIDLRNVLRPITLTFEHVPDVPNATVEVEQDGVVHSLGSVVPAYNDAWNGWRSQVMDISRFAGAQIRLRFAASADFYFPENRTGWWIDDVTVRGTVPSATVVAPSQAGPFTGDLWSGSVVFSNPSPRLVFVASAGSNAFGVGDPFYLHAPNDLAVTLAISTQRVLLGEAVTMTATVFNPGPNPASQTVLTNFAPAGFTVLSNYSSQGTTIAVPGGTVYQLGSIPPGGSALAQLTFRADAPGETAAMAALANSASDSNPQNNTVTQSLQVGLPVITGWSYTVSEASGALGFHIRVEPPPLLPVSFYFETQDITTTSGADYVPTSGWITIPPGASNDFITVPIIEDGLYEGGPYHYEYLLLTLSSVSNAVPGTPLIGSIQGNLYDSPRVFGATVSVPEGNSGLSTGYMTISLSSTAGIPISVFAETIVGEAFISLGYSPFAGDAQDSDFIPFATNVVIPPGALNATLPFVVRGDALHETNEFFSYYLYSSDLWNIRPTIANVYILDDDAPPAIADDWRLVAENCSAPNGAVDPGETVTVELRVRHGGFHTELTGITAAVLPGGGVYSPSAPQVLSTLSTVGSPQWLPFTFSAGSDCGSNLLVSVVFSENGTSRGHSTLRIPIGARGLSWSDGFESIDTNGTPHGWTNLGYFPRWAPTTNSDSGTNAMRVSVNYQYDFAALVSPVFPIISTNAIFSFRHSYAFSLAGSHSFIIEAQPDVNAAWTPLPHEFLQGGPGTNGQWGGTSPGFSTVALQLPVEAAGKKVRFVWLVEGRRTIYGAPYEWTIETVRLEDGPVSCCAGSAPVLTHVSQQGNATALQWLSTPGRQYRVEARNSLNLDVEWVVISPALTATSAKMSYTNSVGSTPRFFRISMQP